jgi:hypothetical protein
LTLFSTALLASPSRLRGTASGQAFAPSTMAWMAVTRVRRDIALRPARGGCGDGSGGRRRLRVGLYSSVRGSAQDHQSCRRAADRKLRAVLDSQHIRLPLRPGIC